MGCHPQLAQNRVKVYPATVVQTRASRERPRGLRKLSAGVGILSDMTEEPPVDLPPEQQLLQAARDVRDRWTTFMAATVDTDPTAALAAVGAAMEQLAS